jgi:hypothetical protein
MGGKTTSILNAELNTPATLDPADAVLLESVTGREDDHGAAGPDTLAYAEVMQPSSGRPPSEVTGRHDAGSGANETIDGLDEREESLRRAAEETAIEDTTEASDDVPVFDRASILPKM